jgi:membrane protease YdiL (CAAX protease family)
MPEPAVKMAAPIPAVLAVINFLLFPLTVPFAEDGLYLGYGVNRIKNDKLAVMIPAFFFAVQHCYIPVFFDVKYILYRFFSFLPLTLVLCWHYRKHRNPLPIMIGHGLIDMSMSVMVLVMSLGPALYESMINA